MWGQQKVVEAAKSGIWREALAMSEGEKGILAGLLMGDGTITVTRGPEVSHRRMFPRVSVTNTDTRILDWVRAILRRHDLVCCITRTGEGGPSRKPCFQAVVQSIVGAHRLLVTVRPYLLAKSYQADLVMTFCRYRLEAIAGQERIVVGKWPARDSVFEQSVFDTIRELNHRGASGRPKGRHTPWRKLEVL